jgi:RHS repeat-associated protein
LNAGADGNRIKKIVASTSTNLYLVATVNPTGYPQVVEELTVTGGGVTNLSRVYAYGLALISQRESSGAVHFFGYDGLGSVRFLTDTNGAVSDQRVFEAFGTQITSSGSTPLIYLFAGEQTDGDLNAYYLRARYYKNNEGRFLAMDSFEGTQSDPLSLHKYLYGADNSVNRVDPSGNGDFNLILLQAAISQVSGLAANLGFRVVPILNKVTIILYESISGSTVVGGAGLLAGGKIAVTVVGGGTKYVDAIAVASAQKIALSGFKEAGKYGVWPFKVLQKLVPVGSGLEKHHLVEKRFASTLGVKEGDIPSIVLTAEEHALYTARWLEQIGRRNMDVPVTTANATLENIWAAAQDVYYDAPELLEFVKTFLNK